MLAVDEKRMRVRLKHAVPPSARGLLGRARQRAAADRRRLVRRLGTSTYFTKYDPTGGVLFDGHLTPGASSYRAFLQSVDGNADSAAPDVAAVRLGAGTTVYASWNGATELAGGSCSGSESQARCRCWGRPRVAGFETAISVRSRAAVDRRRRRATPAGRCSRPRNRSGSDSSPARGSPKVEEMRLAGRRVRPIGHLFSMQSMSNSCAHLHVHSEYSLLDGAAKIDKLAERAAAFGQPALALTDHGVMNGAVELYQAAKKHGIKPIQGCEVYVTDDHTKRGKRHHLTLIAETAAGYRNLVKLCSSGFLDGLQRGKPTVDAGLMAKYSEGVIALTGCLASRFCQALVDDRPGDARATADELLQIYGHENVFFEVQKNGIADQEKANEGIVRIAREVGRPLVGTGDVHYLRREDYDNHTALLCVQTKSTLAAPKMTFDTNEFYLRSNDEMADKFAEWPEALATTLEIAERCDVEIELGKQLIPRFECPGGIVERDYVRQLVMEGLAWRFGDPIPAAALERAEYELGVIDRMGYSGYFLIVWDFIKYARDNGIPVGPGRGSAAGSLVAYALRITDLDPLRYDLLFERFLNPERVSMPDIDVDFSVRGREQVIQYVTDKYGKDSVAQIITFGKMFPRAATRDAARVLGFPYALGDKLAKLIPDPEQGRAPKFDDCLAPGQPLAAEIQTQRRLASDRRGRARARGDRPQRVDPRRRGRDRAAAAHRPGSRAVGRHQQDRRERRQDLPDRHPVLDEAGRGDGPVEDGLPRSAQPRCDRGRARHHRALGGHAAGYDDAAARRREDLRDALARRIGRRLPV